MIDHRYGIGLDIGGTFTDLVLLDEQGGVRVHKLLTTADPSQAALDGIQQLLSTAHVPIGQVDLVVHSTTLITNALIQQKGARTGLLTTRGFRDVLEMRDEHRYDIYDMFLEWPAPLVPRDRRITIHERITRDGQVLEAPRDDEVRSAVQTLVADGVEALAISFLHAYRDPTHEQRVAAIVREQAPDLRLTLSSEVAPVMREYERTSTAVADAYVRPLAEAYLGRMDDGLRAMGFGGRLYLMLSGGGSASLGSARKYPIRLVESGPAAGALAAVLYGQLTGTDPLLSFDMGGTTAKACVVEDGQPTVVNSVEVARTQRFRAGSGIPLVVPSVELLEIGAGGGSIARADAMGLLKVGPDSAGAEPGPACYARGGLEPTVTDANLVLGYLNADYFLGGRMRLDVAAAEAAIGRLASRLGMHPTDTAWGVHMVVNQNMAQAARVHLIERNFDPRRMTIVAFGGAGPAHAAAIARLLGTPHFICPLGAGATSALGCLAAPLSFQFTRSLPGALDGLDWERVNGVLADLEASGRAALAEAAVPTERMTLRREVDARIYGQIHEITIPLPAGLLDADSGAALWTAFTQAYRRLYSRIDPSAVLEMVNWKVTALGPGRTVELRQHGASGVGASPPAPTGRRAAYFGPAAGYVRTAVYDRYALPPGTQLIGPAIVEEREATVIMPPGSRATVDEYGNLRIDLDFDQDAEGLA